MKKNIVIAVVLLVYALGFWAFYKYYIVPQPAKLADLKEQLAEKRRQFLSAQIISKNLENVNDLIENNLVETLSDSLAQASSIPFLNYLTGLIDNLGMVLISMRPASIVRWDQTAGGKLIDQEYIEIPYSMTLLASYKQLGQFLEKLEKSQRLIKVARLQVINPVDFAFYSGDIAGKPDQHRVEIAVHTMTILKESFKGGSKQFN